MEEILEDVVVEVAVEVSSFKLKYWVLSSVLLVFVHVVSLLLSVRMVSVLIDGFVPVVVHVFVVVIVAAACWLCCWVAIISCCRLFNVAFVIMRGPGFDLDGVPDKLEANDVAISVGCFFTTCGLAATTFT